MDFTFTITCSADRTEGKFATRDELAEQIVEALEGANPGSLEGDNEGQYEVTEWSVEEVPQPKRPARRKASTRAAAVVAGTVAALSWGVISVLAAGSSQAGSCSTGATSDAAVCSPGESTLADPKPWLRQDDSSPVVSLTSHVSVVSSGGGAPGSVYRVHPSTGTVTVAAPAELPAVGADNVADWLASLSIGGSW